VQLGRELRRHGEQALLARGRAGTAATELAAQLKEAAATCVDAATIRPNDLSESLYPDFRRSLDEQVGAAVRDAARELSERLHLQIGQELTASAERLSTFGDRIGAALRTVNLEFETPVADKPADSATDRSELAGVLGRLVPPHRISRPGLALPILLGVRLPGSLRGRGILDKLLGNPPTQFRAAYRAAVLIAIDQQFQELQVAQVLDTWVASEFELMRQTAEREVEALLDGITTSLQRVKEQREQGQDTTQRERAEREAVRAELRGMLGTAQRTWEQMRAVA
jgi:hypothetical protein